MKEKEEGTIPCVVSNPQLSVSLHERPDRRTVTGVTYEPGAGFTGPLNDTSYLCVASDGRQKVESQVFYVFSIIGEESTPLRPWLKTFLGARLRSPVCPSRCLQFLR